MRQIVSTFLSWDRGFSIHYFVRQLSEIGSAWSVSQRWFGLPCGVRQFKYLLEYAIQHIKHQLFVDPNISPELRAYYNESMRTFEAQREQSLSIFCEPMEYMETLESLRIEYLNVLQPLSVTLVPTSEPHNMVRALMHDLVESAR